MSRENVPPKHVTACGPIWHVPEMNDMNAVIGANIKRLRKAAKVTQGALAAALGYEDHTRLSKIESGKQGISADQVARIASLLNCNTDEILPKSDRQATVLPLSLTTSVPLMGFVKAGEFMPVEDYNYDEVEYLQVAEAEFPAGRDYFALTVKGTSMNLRFPEGTTLICCPIGQYTDEMRDGMYVIAQRTQHGEAEITVKRYSVLEDGVYLVAETDDVRYIGAVEYNPDDERIFDDGAVAPVEVRAVVLSSMQKHG